NLVNNDLSSSVVTTLDEVIKENGINSLVTSFFVINVGLSFLQNYKDTGDNVYKDEIIAGISAVVETGVGVVYGLAGSVAGAPFGPITSVAGAVSFSYYAVDYYNDNIEPGFTEFLSKGYDY